MRRLLPIVLAVALLPRCAAERRSTTKTASPARERTAPPEDAPDQAAATERPRPTEPGAETPPATTTGDLNELDDTGPTTADDKANRPEPTESRAPANTPATAGKKATVAKSKRAPQPPAKVPAGADEVARRATRREADLEAVTETKKDTVRTEDEPKEDAKAGRGQVSTGEQADVSRSTGNAERPVDAPAATDPDSRDSSARAGEDRRDPPLRLDDGLAGDRYRDNKPEPETAFETGLFDGVEILDASGFTRLTLERFGVRPTHQTLAHPTVTVRVGIDTASYGLARALLRAGRLPPPSSVRAAAFVHALAGDPSPGGARPDIATDPGPVVRLQGNLLPSPNRPGFSLLRLEARVSGPRPPTALTIVIDGTNAMIGQEHAVEALVGAIAAALPAASVVRLAVVGRQVKLTEWLPPRAVSRRALHFGGGADLARGLRTFEARAPKRSNRAAVLISGGALAGRARSDLLAAAASMRGVGPVSVVGVGHGDYDDGVLRAIAHRGGGVYTHIDGPVALGQIVDAAARASVTSAQWTVRFNPAYVSRHRLLGHEARSDGQPEIVPAALGTGARHVTILEVKADCEDAPFGQAAFDFHRGGAAARQSIALDRSVIVRRFEDAPRAARLDVVAALFAERLRGAYWSRGTRYDQLTKLIGRATQPDERRLVETIDIARRLDRRSFGEIPTAPNFDEVPVAGR